MNLCKTSLTFLYKVSNSCIENKEDFVFVILLENKLQTVKRIDNDTEIGNWNILRKSVWYIFRGECNPKWISKLPKTIKAIKCICNGRNKKESGSRL